MASETKRARKQQQTKQLTYDMVARVAGNVFPIMVHLRKDIPSVMLLPASCSFLTVADSNKLFAAGNNSKTRPMDDCCHVHSFCFHLTTTMTSDFDLFIVVETGGASLL